MKKKTSYKLGKPDYIGDLNEHFKKEHAMRRDIPVSPATWWMKTKSWSYYYWHTLCNLIPSVKASRRKSYEDFCKEEMRHREAKWARGESTYMLPLGLGYRGAPFQLKKPDGSWAKDWEDVEFTIYTRGKKN